MVGDLYENNDPRRDAGFSLFYSGINIGALLGGWLCIKVANQFSWNWAFSLAGIFMLIGLSVFTFTQRTLGPIGRSPLHEWKNLSEKNHKWLDLAVYAGSLLVIPCILILVSNSQYTDLFMYIVGPLSLVYIVYEISRCTRDEALKLGAAMIFILFSILFWSFFEQSGGSLSLFARYNLTHEIAGIAIDPNEVNNSANALFVILFSPLVGLIWLALNKRNKEPNTVIKFGLGFLFLAAAFFTFYATRFFANEQGITSLGFFSLAYFIITFGELCLSPIGLSIMTKLAPKRLYGIMMGMWFLASAYGQYVAGLLGADMAIDNPNASKLDKLISYTEGYKQLGWYALISGIILILIAPWVRKLMREVN